MIKNSKLSDREFLSVAIPFMISTMTQPLLGAVDTAIAGRLPSADYIAAIAVGATIFNTLYWLFGFLRVSTTAFSAQAMGKNSKEDISLAMYRPIIMAIGVALVFLIFQYFIFNGAMWLISPSKEVAQNISVYFYLVIWGAPFVLSNYVILGWLMGQRLIRYSMTMQISGNVINALLSVIFAIYFNMGILGIAIGTLTAQIISTIMGIFFVIQTKALMKVSLKGILEKKAWLETLKVNEYLMKRTACLLIHNNIFIAVGARFGTTILAVNGVLFQLNSIVSYSFDGFANASSIFAGKSKGTDDLELLDETIKKSKKWMLVLCGFIIVVYTLLQNQMFTWFTSLDEVLKVLQHYKYWLYVFPVVAGMGLVLYGIYTGTANTKVVFKSTFYGLIGFLIVTGLTLSWFKNHGLWMGVMTFYGIRSLVLINGLPQLVSLKKYIQTQ
ncbi:MATE family multidrug resistance protein [Acetoanaerobium pronyense]|uniref:Probable multidrug resistance protein NorM n=1 Tax=Acetoanaerobium pronyense TaxID=1482736 RepID=A0ABS4KL48_9FIRM|nr:MATE family efflux transporter [Acetoanaerobium pronyense]MBP2028510.1 MATE family multidrug resistance protein [Acetoanaerobium pronyense]